MKKLIAITMALLMATVNLSVADIAPANPPPGNQPALVECVLFVVVVAGGLYVAYKLRQLCNRVMPPANPPPPPPPNQTNAPPIKGASMISTVEINGHSAFVMGDIWEVFDITGAKHAGPDGLEYNQFFVIPFQTSTNLNQWQTHTLTGWLSPTYVLIQCGSSVSISSRQEAMVEISAGARTFLRNAP